MADTPTVGLYQLDELMDRPSLLREFAALPARLAEVVRGAPRERLSARPGRGEWSAFEVVCHFRDVAVVYGLRFRWMVLNDDPFLPNYDEDRWVAECRDTPPISTGSLPTSPRAVLTSTRSSPTFATTSGSGRGGMR